MGKLVILYPEVKLYSHEFDKFYEMDKLGDFDFMCTVTLPPNTTDEDIIYKFEAYANNEPSGMITSITVLSSTQFLDIKEFYTNANELPPSGGDIILYIRFEGESDIVPGIKFVSIPGELYGFNIHRYISNTGDIYISSDKENSGIWMYNKNYNIFDQIFDYGSWTNFYESTINNCIYVGSNNISTRGLVVITDNTAYTIMNSGCNWLTHYLPIRNGATILMTINDSSDGDSLDTVSIYSMNIGYISENINHIYNFDNVYTLISNNLWGQWVNSNYENYVYFSSRSNEIPNLLRYNVEDGTISTIISGGTNWKMFETNKGWMYAACNNNEGPSGLFKVDGDTINTIIDVGYGWTTFFGATNGAIFIAGNNPDAVGIYRLDTSNGNSSQLVISDGYNWMFHEGRDRNVYIISEEIDSQSGMYKISRTGDIDKIIDNVCGEIIFESSMGSLVGEIYVLIKHPSTKLCKLVETGYKVDMDNNTTYDIKMDLLELIDSWDAKLSNFYQPGDRHRVYLSSNSESYPGIYTDTCEVIESKDVYYINSESELLGFIDIVNSNPDGYPYTGILTKDIQLSSAITDPIGTEDSPFTGIFDGRDHSIKGLKISGFASEYVGLFGFVKDSVIKHLTIEGSINTSGKPTGYYNYYTGGIAAYALNSTIERCHSEVKISGHTIIDNSYTGGIVGCSIGSKILSCSNSAQVSVSSNTYVVAVGGIAGQLHYTDNVIEGCFNDANIKITGSDGYAKGFVAGFVGRISDINHNSIESTPTSVTYCYNLGEISSISNNIITSGMIAYNDNINVDIVCKVLFNMGTLIGDNVYPKPYNTNGIEYTGRVTESGVIGDYCLYLISDEEYTNNGLINSNLNTIQGSIRDRDFRGTDYISIANTITGNDILTFTEDNELVINYNKFRKSYYNSDTDYPSFIWERVGLEKENWEVSNVNDLLHVVELIDNLGVTNSTGHSFAHYNIKLMRNINMAGVAWPVIARETSNVFQGIFDGNGHTITIRDMANVDEKGQYYYGLIGMNSGLIKNITVTGMNLNIDSTTRKYVGGICASNSGVIKNCNNEINITLKTSNTIAQLGGIAGTSAGNIVNCKNSGNITKIDPIPNTYLSNPGCAGIVGDLLMGSVYGCVNTGNISCNEDCPISGIACITTTQAIESRRCSIINCYNSGDIINTNYTNSTAGIVSIGKTSMFDIINCYNRGNVSSSNHIYLVHIEGGTIISNIDNNYYLSGTQDISIGAVTESYMKSMDMISLLNSNDINKLSLYHYIDNDYPRLIWEDTALTIISNNPIVTVTNKYTVTIDKLYEYGYNWKYWEERGFTITVLSDKPFGEIYISRNSDNFVVNENVDSDYSHNLIGELSLKDDNSKTKIWNNKKTLVEFDDPYSNIIENNNIYVLENSEGSVDKLLIIDLSE